MRANFVDWNTPQFKTITVNLTQEEIDNFLNLQDEDKLAYIRNLESRLLKRVGIIPREGEFLEITI